MTARLPIALGLAALLLLAAAPSPGFHPVPLPGAPRDVFFADAGHFVVVATVAAGLDAGIEYTIDASGSPQAGLAIASSTAGQPLVSAVISNTGCLGGYTANFGHVGCGPVMVSTPTSKLYRVAWTPELAAYAAGDLQTGSNSKLEYSPSFASSFVNATYLDPDLALPAVSALRVNGTDWGTIGVAGGVLAFQNGSSTSPVADLPTGDQAVHDLSLATIGGKVGVFVAEDGGLYRADLSTGTAGTAELLLAAEMVTGVSFNGGTGDAFGEGYGAAVVWNGGVSELYRAVPNPNAPGRIWVPSTTAMPVVQGQLQRVVCNGGQTCALLGGGATGDNFGYFLNTSGPVLPGPITLDEGTRTTLTYAVTDPDGDPVYLTWSAGAGAAQVAPDAGSVDNREITVVAGAANCGTPTTPVSIPVVASDGYAPHDLNGVATVIVNHTVHPNAPQVGPSSATLPAGTGAVTFTASPAATGCAPTSYTWTPVSGAIGFTASGGVLTVTPPATACDAQTATFRVVGTEAGLDSPPSTVTVQVQPFGAPLDPLDAPLTRSITAGQSLTIDARQHVCPTAPVTTSWTLDPGTVPGIVAVFPSGGPTGQGAQAVIQTQACVGGVAHLTAQNLTHGPPELASDAGTLTLLVDAGVVPLSAVPLEIDGGFDPLALAYRGSATAPAANCVPERERQAQLSLFGSDGGLLDSRTVPFGAPFTFAPPGCSGGDFTLRGRAIEDGGESGPVSEAGFSAPEAPVGIEGITPTELKAVCGRGFDGQLEVVIDAGFCTSADYAWTRTSGPALTAQPLSGAQVQVHSADTGLDALVGTSLGVSVVATSATGASATANRTIAITADPFVEITHQAEPLSAESQVLHVTVRLRNQTACAVTGVELVEALGGMSFVPGSARLSGAVVAEAVEQDGQLRVPGIALPAEAVATVTYAARPRLFGEPRPSGQAFLRAIPVSAEAGLSAAQPACGCTGAEGAPLTALGLVALELLSRGRRRGSARSDRAEAPGKASASPN